MCPAQLHSVNEEPYNDQGRIYGDDREGGKSKLHATAEQVDGVTDGKTQMGDDRTPEQRYFEQVFSDNTGDERDVTHNIDRDSRGEGFSEAERYGHQEHPAAAPQEDWERAISNWNDEGVEHAIATSQDSRIISTGPVRDQDQDDFATTQHSDMANNQGEEENRAEPGQEANVETAALGLLFAKRPGAATGASTMWTPWANLGGSLNKDPVAKVDCSGMGEPKCLCGPQPVTVAPGCTALVYDHCENTLNCVNQGFNGDY
jgi:hypothetical protein